MEGFNGVLRRSPVTILLIVVNFIFYAYESYLSGSFISIKTYALVKAGAQINACIDHCVIFQLSQGYMVCCHQWWRLITSMFVHMSIMHIGLNMFWLFYLGAQLEPMIGTKRFLLTYFSAGLLGNVISFYMLGSLVISGGASGAIFGVAGALIMIGGVLGRNLERAIANAFFLLLLNSWMQGVNVFAHFGGMVAGLVFGYIYGKEIKRRMQDMSFWFS